MPALVVGYGHIADEAWSRHFETGGMLSRAFGGVAVVDTCWTARDRAKKRMGLRYVYDDVATACSSRYYDSAVILTPPRVSVEVAEHIFKLGVSRILVEKPFTLDLEILARFQRLVEWNALSIAVVQNYLYRPDLAFALRAIRDGAIGNLLGGDLSTVDKKPWKGWGNCPSWRTDAGHNPQGVLGDKGYHLLYIVDELTQHCTLNQYYSYNRREWNATARNGYAEWKLRASWRATAQENDNFMFYGDKGTISLNGLDLGTVMIKRDNEKIHREYRVSGDDWWGYSGVISNFIRGVDNSWRRHTNVARMVFGG